MSAKIMDLLNVVPPHHVDWAEVAAWLNEELKRDSVNNNADFLILLRMAQTLARYGMSVRVPP